VLKKKEKKGCPFHSTNGGINGRNIRASLGFWETSNDCRREG
jgi:hypothetical protein